MKPNKTCQQKLTWKRKFQVNLKWTAEVVQGKKKKKKKKKKKRNE